MKKQHRLVLVGFMIHASITCLIQDWYGMEEYTARNWVPSYIGVPISIVILCIAIVIYYKES